MNQRCLIAGFWNAFWLLSFTWFEYLHLHSVSIYFADFYFAAYFNLLYKFNFYGFCVLPLILCSKECTFYYPFSYKTCFLTPTIAQVGKNVSCVNSTILLVFYHPSHLFFFFFVFLRFCSTSIFKPYWLQYFTVTIFSQERNFQGAAMARSYKTLRAHFQYLSKDLKIFSFR